MENTKQTYWTTYQYYDDQGRRLSISGEVKSGNVLEVTVVTCTRKDQFNRSFGRQALSSLRSSDNVTINEDLIHPYRDDVIFSGEMKPRSAFFAYCNANYRKKYTIPVISTMEILMSRDEFIEMKNSMEV